MSRTIQKLNPRKLDGLSEPGWHGDGEGLWLRIKPNGSKSWKFVWVRDGKRREMGLGSYRAYTLAEAREMAVAARNLLKEGQDPLEFRKAVHELEEKERAESVEKTKPTAVAPTFLTYAKEYIAAHEEGWSNEKHIWQWTNSLTKHAKAILTKRVDMITPDDLVAILKPIWVKIPDTAGRVRGRIENILDAAKAQGHIKSPWENPARWKGNLVHRLPKRKRLATGHYSAVPYEAMPDFFQAVRHRPAPAARALELTVLCATRTSETLKARWREIDLKRGTWTIPAERMKMRVEHSIPLSVTAVELLKMIAQGRSPKPDDFVFPGQKVGKPLSQMSMTMVMRRMDLGHYTVHGMRSAFRDYMGDMTGHAENIIEHALAHQVGDSTARAYRRKNAFDKRRLVMADWAEFLIGTVVEFNLDGEVQAEAA
ncbi:tyrosine-type recombinase/integrase [Sphingomonas abietis]|uniref:Tyrosine-type recombinase/integrase n=1 Tax=Sphingomonas abietis TaxID=3012344 RepID=A0ABY7NK46_9SPHN|nr:site-specific integrase [Sphingomonas abietis]WBO21708.1 tyrosine-type recombinase/integrase [Sphingomonas abietis]